MNLQQSVQCVCPASLAIGTEDWIPNILDVYQSTHTALQGALHKSCEQQDTSARANVPHHTHTHTYIYTYSFHPRLHSREHKGIPSSCMLTNYTFNLEPDRKPVLNCDLDSVLDAICPAPDSDHGSTFGSEHGFINPCLYAISGSTVVSYSGPVPNFNTSSNGDLDSPLGIDIAIPDGLIQFEQLLINYTLLIPPNTEKKLEPWIFDFADDVDVWPGLPTIIYALDYRSVNYHRQSRYGAKTFSSAVEAVVHM
ncbi:hypothetical protein EVAR_80955_1 [Eumeta japonica]|uniref:Uncharacterized protein n=1 Tax=Eumeta variegata TaxID=151549 RepID=A0A4C1WS93_EUMVA|nr:hypothetical protein EVAR_80955_1 [Eumeta japonica]